MRPAPPPMARLTLPLPQRGLAHCSFGQTSMASALIDWNMSKECPHFSQIYSYVGIARQELWWRLPVVTMRSGGGGWCVSEHFSVAALTDFDVEVDLIVAAGFGETGLEFFGACGGGAVEAATDPFEPAGDGEFVLQAADLVAEEGEVVELAFEVRFFGLEAFEFGEQEFAVAFGGGEFAFCIRDLVFQGFDGAGQVLHFVIQVGVTALEVLNFLLFFVDLVLGGLGFFAGFGLGGGESGLQVFDLGGSLVELA